MKPKGFITKSLESEVTIYMALFKILKGPEKKDSTGKSVMLNPVASGLAIKEGWAYVTDAGNFYVDISDTTRVKINQNADFSVKAENDSSNQKITDTYIKNVRLVSGANPSYEFIRGDNTAFSISIPTVLSGFTANRLIYSSSATAINSTSHYADATSVAINSTSAPTIPYKLYVNGGVNLNNALYSDNIVTASTSTVTDITASNVSTYFTVTNDPTYYFTNPGSYTETIGAPTGTAITMTLGTVGSYFTFTNDATHPWYMDGNYWRPKNVKDANSEYNNTDSKITLVNSSTTAVALKLSYDMRTESSSYDYIYIKVNNVEVGSHCGGTTSGNFTFEVPANATVEIHYRKDGSSTPSGEYVKILLERYPGYTAQSVTKTLQGWAPTNIANTNTTAKTTFKAKNNCVLTFTITYNKYSSDYFYIYKNGISEYLLSNQATKDAITTKKLQVFANDIIEIRFFRSTNTDSIYKHYAYFTLGYQAGSTSKQNRSTYSFNITSTTNSISTTTGALVVSGGIGAAGNIYGSKVYNAVWNDYAEFRKAETLEPGRVVIEDTSGEMKLSSERLQPGASIISDTFGSAMGETEECKTPIAVAGRVLTYYHGDINMYTVGAAVGTGPNGTVSLMTREEIMTYPDRIVGIVSEIPSYEEWGPEHIKVNGRIWIKIK